MVEGGSDIQSSPPVKCLGSAEARTTARTSESPLILSNTAPSSVQNLSNVTIIRCKDSRSRDALFVKRVHWLPTKEISVVHPGDGTNYITCQVQLEEHVDVVLIF